MQALQSASPDAAEQTVRDYWHAFFARATRLELPDPILNDIFLSRLATRAVLDVPISDRMSSTTRAARSSTSTTPIATRPT